MPFSAYGSVEGTGDPSRDRSMAIARNLFEPIAKSLGIPNTQRLLDLQANCTISTTCSDKSVGTNKTMKRPRHQLFAEEINKFFRNQFFQKSQSSIFFISDKYGQ
jgi:hypothetical protein